jgi:nicotinamide-nucleotide amidase
MRFFRLFAFYQTVVGDNPDRVKGVLRDGLKRSDIIIVTGGLGPTKDDLTKEMAAEVMDIGLVRDSETLERLHSFFRGLPGTDYSAE